MPTLEEEKKGKMDTRAGAPKDVATVEPSEKDIPLDEMAPVIAQEARSWFKKSPGAYIYGIWMGRFKKTWKDDDDSQYYHQIRLIHPVTAMVPKDGDEGGSVEKKLSKGAVVNLDETATLESMARLEEDARKATHGIVVYAKCIKKEAIRGTAKTIWRYDVRSRPARAGDVADSTPL